MRRLALLLLALSCAPPIPAVPTSAGAARGLSICWSKPAATDKGTKRALHEALATRLEGAGYLLVPSKCDLDLSWRWYSRNDTTFEAFLAVDLKVQSGSLVDQIRLEYGATDVPVSQPDRLAILMVNALNASPKVAQVARARDTQPIVVSQKGITVRAGRSQARLDMFRIHELFPAGTRVDVSLASDANMQSVQTVLSDLAALQRPFVHLHAGASSAATGVDVDLLRTQKWSGGGAWVGVALGPRSNVTTIWRTDRACAQVPRSMHAEDDPHMEKLAADFATCPTNDCFTRLLMNNVGDVGTFLQLLAIASRALHAPVPLDVGGFGRFDPTCDARGGPIPNEDLEVLVRNHLPTLIDCAPQYHGPIRATWALDRAGAVTSVSVDFDQAGIERVEGRSVDVAKTCIATELAELSFPPGGVTPVTHAFALP